MERVQVGSGGPYEERVGYSRAVRVGAHVHVAGTAARERELAAGADAAAQARAAWAIVVDALERVGASTADVVRTVTYLVDADDAEAVGDVHGELFGDVRPAATMLAVAALVDARMRVEVEAWAILSGPV